MTKRQACLSPTQRNERAATESTLFVHERGSEAADEPVEADRLTDIQHKRVEELMPPQWEESSGCTGNNRGSDAGDKNHLWYFEELGRNSFL